MPRDETKLELVAMLDRAPEQEGRSICIAGRRPLTATGRNGSH